jgi:hypothetical protein
LLLVDDVGIKTNLWRAEERQDVAGCGDVLSRRSLGVGVGFAGFEAQLMICARRHRASEIREWSNSVCYSD